MTIRLFGACIAALVFVQPAAAEITGNDFLALAKSDPAVGSFYVSGYTAGAFAVKTMAQIAAAGAKLPPSAPLARATFCPPDNSTAAQAFDVIVQHLERNPATRNREMSLLAWTALHDAWPCPLP